MHPFIRHLKADHPDGVEGEIVGVNHVVRSAAEIKAKADQHYLLFLKVGDTVYVDIIDSDREEELAAGQTVKITWTTTKEGDGMPIVS